MEICPKCAFVYFKENEPKKQTTIDALNNLLWYETIPSSEKDDIATAIKLLGGHVDDYNE